MNRAEGKKQKKRKVFLVQWKEYFSTEVIAENEDAALDAAQARYAKHGPSHPAIHGSGDDGDSWLAQEL
jgi:hypothetical protein